MLPFVALGGATALYTLWGLTPIHLRCMSKEIVLCTSIQRRTNRDCGALCDRDVRLAILLEGKSDGDLRRGEFLDPDGRNGGSAVRLHLAVVCVCGGRKHHHSRLLLEKQRQPPFRYA